MYLREDLFLCLAVIVNGRLALQAVTEIASVQDRDSYIVQMIIWVAQRGHLSPTINPATDDTSACKIVAKALRRFGIQATESSIKAIWRQRKIVEQELLKPGEIESALPFVKGRMNRSCDKEIHDFFGSSDVA